MAQLVCGKCGGKRPVPKVHDGPGVISRSDPAKLSCPAHGEQCGTVPIPQCCGTTMKYTS